jgi:S-adenosylmethionine-diacylglycerol 3-amino-3-carboxypropyl transferase
MHLRDKAFQAAFSRLFVYNILWEDAEVDERFLGVGEDSSVLSITGAGCGVAGMVSRRPRQMDCVDINKHHLALAALKVTAAQRLAPYSTFYDLVGRGWASDPDAVVGQLSAYLPGWMQRYWRSHAGRFERSMYHEGVTAKMTAQVREIAGVDVNWLRSLIPLSIDRRIQILEEWLTPVLSKPIVRAVMGSPLQLVALGINFSQRERIEETERANMVDFFMTHGRRIMATDLEKNWFAWQALAGQFNHDNEDAVPPYLRRDRWETSLNAPTHVRYHNRNLFDVMGEAGPRTWSHYTLCDMPDWLPPATQKHMLDEIFRTSRDGAIVLYRTVEEDCIVQRHSYEKRMIPLAEPTRIASELDRSRQYRRVNFYQVAH